MFQECKFSKDCDLQQHVPSLTMDFRKAIDSGIVPPTSSVQDFNNMDIEIAENATRLRDNFDAFEYDQRLKSFGIEFASGTGNNTITQPSTEGNAV